MRNFARTPPKRRSRAPNTSRWIRACTSAPAHMAQGSSVTHRSQSTSLSLPSATAAARIAATVSSAGFATTAGSTTRAGIAEIHEQVVRIRAAGPAVADESKVCRSPIAGVVVRINAQVGQQIHPNDPLVVLEAMKMETNITAPVAGKIKAINVGVGEAVAINQVVVEFE